jgi:hypothetical protein
VADVDCIHLRFCFRVLYPLFTGVEISPGLHIYSYALDPFAMGDASAGIRPSRQGYSGRYEVWRGNQNRRWSGLP